MCVIQEGGGGRGGGGVPGANSQSMWVIYNQVQRFCFVLLCACVLVLPSGAFGSSVCVLVSLSGVFGSSVVRVCFSVAVRCVWF